jgi:hypothetical protein
MNVGPGIISTASMWIISRKRQPLPNPTSLIPSMAEKEKHPHIWEGEGIYFSNIRATFPQLMGFIHRFQQVIHIRKNGTSSTTLLKRGKKLLK